MVERCLRPSRVVILHEQYAGKILLEIGTTSICIASAPDCFIFLSLNRDSTALELNGKTDGETEIGSIAMGGQYSRCDPLGGVEGNAILLPRELYVRDARNDARMETRLYVPYYCRHPLREALSPW